MPLINDSNNSFLNQGVRPEIPMAPQIIRLPDGQSFTVTPVFAGLFFKSNELSTHPNAFPIGWSVVLHTKDAGDDAPSENSATLADGETDKAANAHFFAKPTLHNDHLFISSISSPSSHDFKPAVSPSRQLAMMLWITLYWYFHQPAPSSVLHTNASAATPETGKPRGEWRINISRDGVLRGKNLLPKLERMGLVASLDSAVGATAQNSELAWSRMFVSQKAFWQIPARLFLFTLQPAPRDTPSQPGSPSGSRPGSPVRPSGHLSDRPGTPPAFTITSIPSFPIGPFFSTSHLPTYYPPAPLQYTTTDRVRHPVRPKPPQMGEVFYTRFVPSVGQYLAFRAASSSDKPVPYLGPVGPRPPHHPHLGLQSDTSLLQAWLENPRVRAFWGGYTPGFLTSALASRHSFPVIGLWDGVPFGYFEVYWVKEDGLGRLAGGAAADDWDRGLHVLVGEEWARGRVQPWLSSLVHWVLTADYRTMSVCVEPRVDNAR